MKFTTLIICFLALLPLSSNAQLTIEQVKSNIVFDGYIGISLNGLCDAWYAKALQSGMTQEQAASLALDSLGSTLLRMADWKMPDSTEHIKVDGGGKASDIPVMAGLFFKSANEKKDTILVHVLCTDNKIYTYTTDSFPIGLTTFVAYKELERTLELQWVSVHTDNPATNGIAGSRQWVVKSTRWLHDMEGCYHLVKITDGSPSSN